MDDENVEIITDDKRIEYKRDAVPYKYLNMQIDGVALPVNRSALLIYTKDCE